MSLDYDLVIVGNTLEAFSAAFQAVKLKARVALVLGNNKSSLDGEIDRFILSYFIHVDRHWQNLTQWELNPKAISNLNIAVLQKYLTQIKQDISDDNYPATLARAGVDVIDESGEFCRLPQLGFVLRNRTLRSRRYLLAMGSLSTIPDIQGLSDTGYLTPETLSINRLPHQLMILSQTPLGIELAQTLNRLGKQVTLVVESSRILPQEDSDVVQLIQAQLESEGIKLLTNCPVTQVRMIDDKKWIQAGNEAIEAEEIILVTQKKPNLAHLNLEGIKVAVKRNQIVVNSKLQTTHSKIYACGSITGGYDLSNIAQYEASIAVKNAIFCPWFQVDYQFYPFRIFTRPILSRVGLTENQARQRYDKDIIVVRQDYKTLTKAKILDEMTGFCKIITHRNGKILGCHVIGNQSDELINLVAFAMRHNLKIQQFSQLFSPHITTCEILSQIANRWQHQKAQTNQVLSDWLETILFWRRKWNR